MTDEEFYGKIDFTVEVNGDENRIEIVPYIEAYAEKNTTLIAAFRVDAMEMIESARISLSPGWNRIPFLQSVRIVRPSLWHPGGHGKPSLYSLGLVFYKKGMPYYLIEKRVGFRFAEMDSDSLFINGNMVSCVRFEPDFSIPEEQFEAICMGNPSNFIFLKDSDPALETKLERCNKFGVIAAMELSGVRPPSFFSTHPCVCVFTAPPDSEGEKSVRKDSKHAPLVSLEQLLELF